MIMPQYKNEGNNHASDDKTRDNALIYDKWKEHAFVDKKSK